MQIQTSNAVIILHDSFLTLLLGSDYGKNVVEDWLLIKNMFKAKKVDCMVRSQDKVVKKPTKFSKTNKGPNNTENIRLDFRCKWLQEAFYERYAGEIFNRSSRYIKLGIVLLQNYFRNLAIL